MKIKTAHRLARKERAYKEILKNHVFDDYGYRGLDETIERIKKHRGVIAKFADLAEQHDNIDHRRCNWSEKYPKHLRDYRTGYETYGYETIESIEGNLSYIADRFIAGFRLRWMLNVPEEVEKLRNNS